MSYAVGDVFVFHFAPKPEIVKREVNLTREQREWIRREINRLKRERLSKDPAEERGIINRLILQSDPGASEATYVRCMTPDLLPTRLHRGYEAAQREWQGGSAKEKRPDWFNDWRHTHHG